MNKIEAYRAGFAQGYFEKRAYDPSGGAPSPYQARDLDELRRRITPQFSKVKPRPKFKPIPERQVRWYNTDTALLGTPETPERHEINKLMHRSVLRPFTSLDYYKGDYLKYWAGMADELKGLLGAHAVVNPRAGL